MSPGILDFLPEGSRIVETPGRHKPFYITEDRQYDTITEALENLQKGETLFCLTGGEMPELPLAPSKGSSV